MAAYELDTSIFLLTIDIFSYNTVIDPNETTTLNILLMAYHLVDRLTFLCDRNIPSFEWATLIPKIFLWTKVVHLKFLGQMTLQCVPLLMIITSHHHIIHINNEYNNLYLSSSSYSSFSSSLITKYDHNYFFCNRMIS